MTMAVSDIETQDLLKSIDAKLGSIVTIMAKNANVTENRKSSKIEQDPYTEQRKWIGKLCRFWDDDAFITSNDWAFGILTSIDKGMQYQYCCNENCNFKHCEPVKPDDDIIYKGE